MKSLVSLEGKVASKARSSPSLPSAGERAGERRINLAIIDDKAFECFKWTPLPFANGEGTEDAAEVNFPVFSIYALNDKVLDEFGDGHGFQTGLVIANVQDVFHPMRRQP